jgi:hypothetical protein
MDEEIKTKGGKKAGNRGWGGKYVAEDTSKKVPTSADNKWDDSQRKKLLSQQQTKSIEDVSERLSRVQRIAAETESIGSQVTSSQRISLRVPPSDSELSKQRQILDEQDKMLDDLSQSIECIKEIATRMNSELQIQSCSIDEISSVASQSTRYHGTRRVIARNLGGIGFFNANIFGKSSNEEENPLQSSLPPPPSSSDETRNFRRFAKTKPQASFFRRQTGTPSFVYRRSQTSTRTLAWSCCILLILYYMEFIPGTLIIFLPIFLYALRLPSTSQLKLVNFTFSSLFETKLFTGRRSSFHMFGMQDGLWSFNQLLQLFLHGNEEGNGSHRQRNK